MKCHNIILFSSIIILLISYIYYNKYNLNYTLPPLQNLPKLSCEKIYYTRLMEDFAKIDDNTLITGGANFIDFYKDFSIYNPGYKFDQGTMALFDIKNKNFKNLELKNFPEKVNFFPLGIKFFKDKYIYVLNHALNSIDGERIEIFEIIYESKWRKNISHLNYIKSIILPKNFMGITNGLAVVEEDDIFFTTSYTVPAPPTDKVNFFNKNFFLFVKWANYDLNLKMTYLYHYKNGTITKIKESNSWCDNGVAYDEINSLVFLAQTYEKNIRVFKYEKNGDVKFVKDIYLGYRIDNLIFDEKNRVLNAAITGNEGYGGLAEIYPDKNYGISYPFYDVINVTSASAIQINKKVYIVSPHVKYLLECQ